MLLLNVPEGTDLFINVGISIDDGMLLADVDVYIELDDGAAISRDGDRGLLLPPPPSSFAIPALLVLSCEKLTDGDMVGTEI